MEQRPLRLGDIVDDYCPRERRVTNHAIVAIIGDAIRQTRCSTCEAEHVYKHGKEPKRRLPDVAAGAIPSLADSKNSQLAAPLQANTSDHDRGPVDPPAADASEADGNVHANDSSRDIWPAHRQLIRATLPRVEGEQPAPRPIPEFTMHQRQRPQGGRGFRHGGWNPNANGNVNGNTNGGGRSHVDGRPGRSGRHHGKNRRPR